MEETKVFPIKGLVFHRFQDKTAPRFICQYCEDFIEEAGMALLVWNSEEHEALAVHKRCDPMPTHQGHLPMSMALDVELAYLLVNTGMGEEALKQAQETGRALMEC